MSVIFLTHGSAKKDPLQASKKAVYPFELYTARPLVRFMNRCMTARVNWAILSLEHGIWFPYQKHSWYDVNIYKIDNSKVEYLISNFDDSLKDFKEIWFYYNSSRFYKIYQKILSSNKLKDRIKLFSDIHMIDSPRY